MRQRGKKIHEDNLTDLWDNIKRPNIQIAGVPEEEDKKKRHEKVQETQRVPNRINPRRNTPDTY